MSDRKEKTCWACKRIIVGKNRFGLCSDCADKAGSTAAAIGGAFLTVGGIIVKKKGFGPFKKG